MASLIVIGIVLALYVVGIVSMSASGYGMGKEDADKQGAKYKAAASFFVIGLVLVLISTSVLTIIL